MEEETHFKFKPGDLIVWDPEVKLTDEQVKRLHAKGRGHILTLPFLTVKKVGEKGFTIEEIDAPAYNMNYNFFVVKDNPWEKLPEPEKTRFIREVLGCLYLDRTLYDKINKLIEPHEHRTT